MNEKNCLAAERLHALDLEEEEVSDIEGGWRGWCKTRSSGYG